MLATDRRHHLVPELLQLPRLRGFPSEAQDSRRPVLGRGAEVVVVGRGEGRGEVVVDNVLVQPLIPTGPSSRQGRTSISWLANPVDVSDLCMLMTLISFF